jgi:PiT family inorganic phosphate transporter
MIRFRQALVLMVIFVLLGAWLEGARGLRTIGGLATQTPLQASLLLFSAALVVTIVTKLKLPVSISQSVIGAIIGAGLWSGGVNWGNLPYILSCWVATPFLAALVSASVYAALFRLFQRMELNFIGYDRLIRTGLVLCGCYAAYALGANNVGNVTGVFFKAGLFTLDEACLFGGLAIALGMATYSKNVIETLGSNIVPLSPFGALVAALASAFSVHMFAELGVPVAASQAAVGGVIGIALIEGLNLLNARMVGHIGVAWVMSPILSGLLAYGLMFLTKVRVVILP